MSALFASQIRSIASLALCGQTKLTDALREIVAECNAQNDHVVTLTVEEAEDVWSGLFGTGDDRGMTEQTKKVSDLVRRQLDEIEEFERIAAEDRHRAKQF